MSFRIKNFLVSSKKKKQLLLKPNCQSDLYTSSSSPWPTYNQSINQATDWLDNFTKFLLVAWKSSVTKLQFNFIQEMSKKHFLYNCWSCQSPQFSTLANSHYNQLVCQHYTMNLFYLQYIMSALCWLWWKLCVCWKYMWKKGM